MEWRDSSSGREDVSYTKVEVMAKKHDGWVFKNKWGSLLFWTFGNTRRECREKVADWRQWEKYGHKPVKVKLVEVE